MESKILERLSFENKSIDMKKRLEMWRAVKRNQQRESEDTLRWNPSTMIDKSKTGPKQAAAFTPASKKKQFTRTPASKDRFLSPSKRGTYKDDSLNMRNRLEMWLHEKGKTPQNQSVSTKRRILKTPSVTPNQRRKTWSFDPQHDDDLKRNEVVKAKGLTAGKTRQSSRGILKTRSFTEQKMRTTKTCSFLPQDEESKDDESKDDEYINYLPPAKNKSSRKSLVVWENGLRQSLENCFEMLNKDHNDQDEIVFTLDDIQRDHPNALRHALYWICRAKLAENDGDHDRVVCMFEQATAFSAQPEEDIQIAFNDFKTRKQRILGKENESPYYDDGATLRTPRKTPSRELAGLDGEVFSSSVIRFCVMDSTRFKKRSRSASEKRILTPVRRTSRWERCGISHPKAIEEKNVTVASLDELSNQLRSTLVFKPNSLLPCDLDTELRNCLQDGDGF